MAVELSSARTASTAIMRTLKARAIFVGIYIGGIPFSLLRYSSLSLSLFARSFTQRKFARTIARANPAICYSQRIIAFRLYPLRVIIRCLCAQLHFLPPCFFKFKYSVLYALSPGTFLRIVCGNRFPLSLCLILYARTIIHAPSVRP